LLCLNQFIRIQALILACFIHGILFATKATKRSADLTRQLLAFARKQTIVPRIIDLNEVIESILNILLHLIGENIEFFWIPETKKFQINIDLS